MNEMNECAQGTPSAGAAQVGPDFDYIVECYQAERRRADVLQERHEHLVTCIADSLPEREAGKPWSPAAQVRALIARCRHFEADVERFVHENAAQREQIQELRTALRTMASLVAESEAKAQARAR